MICTGPLVFANTTSHDYYILPRSLVRFAGEKTIRREHVRSGLSIYKHSAGLQRSEVHRGMRSARSCSFASECSCGLRCLFCDRNTAVLASRFCGQEFESATFSVGYPSLVGFEIARWFIICKTIFSATAGVSYAQWNWCRVGGYVGYGGDILAMTSDEWWVANVARAWAYITFAVGNGYRNSK